MTGRSALVIDDSKSARFALRRYLEGHRYEVEAVESADEAMRVLSERRPGVIFLDHVMPDVDGLTVLRKLRANPDTAPIPVVMCSSSEGPDFDAQARAAGANGVLQKPPSPDQLRRILEGIERGAALDAAPAPTLPAPPIAAPVPPATPVPATPPPAAAVPPVAGGDAVREGIERRVAQIEQNLLAQVAELRSTVAHLAHQPPRPAQTPLPADDDLRLGLDRAQQALRGLTARVEGIERDLQTRMAELRTHLDAALEAQATRTAERLAHAILGAIGRR